MCIGLYSLIYTGLYISVSLYRPCADLYRPVQKGGDLLMVTNGDYL